MMGRLESISFMRGTTSDNSRFLIEDNVIIEKGTSDVALSGGEKGDTLICYAPEQTRESYTIPATVRSFFQGAFEDANLTSVEIPEGVEVLPAGLFANAKLTSVTIPASVKQFDNGDISWGSMGMDDGNPVFFGCPLETVTFADGSLLKEIPEATFRYNKLTTFEVPAGIEKIGKLAFASKTLTSITVAEGNRHFASVDGVLYNKSMTDLICVPGRTENYIAPTTLKRVLSGAFAYCWNINRIELNEGLEEIGDHVFEGCAVKELVLPSTLKKIGQSYVDKSRLEYLELNMSEPPEVLSRGFLMDFINPNQIKIIVPEENYEAMFDWLNEYGGPNLGNYIDVSAYVHATTYVFDNDGERTTVKAKVLNSYELPEFKGEGTKYFHGWFLKDGDEWGTEIKLPAKNPDDVTVTYYAKCGDEPRRDGTAEHFAYKLELDTPLTITVTEEFPFVYFETSYGLEQEEFNVIIFNLIVNGEWIGSISISKDNVPEDRMLFSGFDFSQLIDMGIIDSLPTELVVTLTLEVY